MTDDDIVHDDDVPKTDQEFWDRAIATPGGGPRAVLEALEKRRQGERGQQKSPTKVLVTIRLDQRVVSYFKANGKGWQTRLNQALVDLVTRDREV